VVAATIHLVRGEPSVSATGAACGLHAHLCELPDGEYLALLQLKDLNLRNRHPFQIFILFAIFGLLCVPHYMLFIIAISYR